MWGLASRGAVGVVRAVVAAEHCSTRPAADDRFAAGRHDQQPPQTSRRWVPKNRRTFAAAGLTRAGGSRDGCTRRATSCRALSIDSCAGPGKSQHLAILGAQLSLLHGQKPGAPAPEPKFRPEAGGLSGIWGRIWLRSHFQRLIAVLPLCIALEAALRYCRRPGAGARGSVGASFSRAPVDAPWGSVPVVRRPRPSRCPSNALKLHWRP